MSRRAILWLVVVLAAIGIYLARKSPRTEATRSLATPGTMTPPSIGGSAPSATPVQPSLLSISEQINAVLDHLRRGTSSPEEIAALRERLLHGDPAQAIAAIRAFLASGQDAPTGEEFLVGSGGILSGSPTLRVLALDALGRLSKSDAAAVAREILQTKGSPDEWAVSLRNLGWHEPANTAFLAAKAQEMLSYEPWRKAPSAGFLEAFDVAVYARDASLLPTLSELSRASSAPLQRAATVALDRLSEASPLAVMNYLNAHPSELAEIPFRRADYFAKADLSDPAQRDAVEAYLSRADVAADEKTKLLKGLTSPGSFVTDALLSAPVVRAESPAREAAVGSTLEAWAKSARFPELGAPLQQTLQRLGR